MFASKSLVYTKERIVDMREDYSKKAEKKIREWLDRPEEGYHVHRIPDQTTGQKGSQNISDFYLYKYPNFYYIESKSVSGEDTQDRFDFSLITDYQHDEMLKASKIPGIFGYVIVLFVWHKRAFLFDINDIKEQEDKGVKSLNIKKIDKWTIPYKEIKTIPNNRKELLDYDPVDNVL